MPSNKLTPCLALCMTAIVSIGVVAFLHRGARSPDVRPGPSGCLAGDPSGTPVAFEIAAVGEAESAEESSPADTQQVAIASTHRDPEQCEAPRQPDDEQALTGLLEQSHRAITQADITALFECCEALRDLFEGMDEGSAYAMLSRLGDAQLRDLGIAINFSRHDSGGQAADLDSIDKYPRALVPYMLDVARGAWGNGDRWYSAIDFFQFCRDCPGSVYSAGVSVLQTSRAPDLIRKAILQLEFADPTLNLGQDELVRVALDSRTYDRALRGAAIQAACKLPDGANSDCLRSLLLSSDMTDVELGLAGLMQFFGPRTRGARSADPERDQRFAMVLSQLYPTLSPPMRTTVVATAIEIQDAEVADELLSFLANCDDTAAHQELLERARERLATEDRHVVMVDVLSAW